MTVTLGIVQELRREEEREVKGSVDAAEDEGTGDVRETLPQGYSTSEQEWLA